VLVLIVAERTVALPPAFLWEARADARTCAVYRSFYRDVSKRQPAVLHAGTARWLPFISLDQRDARTGLTSLDVRSGWPATSSDAGLTVDVSAYFAPLMRGQSLFIRHCFEGSGEMPFFDGVPQLLYISDELGGVDRTLWWQVSPVGFSPDGQRALIYATDTCYGWCGFGVFFLFERRGQDWVLSGSSLAWIT
jgi:hypothetical protein